VLRQRLGVRLEMAIERELIGDFLDHYEIKEFIGKGGFAYVYKAWDHYLRIWVAIKILRSSYSNDAAFNKSLLEEARIAAKLNHPNIISIKYIGRYKNRIFFVMDYYKHSLRDFLKKGRISPARSIKYGMDIARALGYAHKFRMIHRDIKPGNILIDEDNNAVVADFGIASATTRYKKITGSTLVVGTPEYMSPEQAAGEPIDVTSDIYSLGCTLYEMVTGKVPFVGSDWYEIGRKHLEMPPVPPRKINPVIPAGLEAVILKCLEKKKRDRFQSAHDLLLALDEVRRNPFDSHIVVQTDFRNKGLSFTRVKDVLSCLYSTIHDFASSISESLMRPRFPKFRRRSHGKVKLNIREIAKKFFKTIFTGRIKGSFFLSKPWRKR